MAKLLEQAIAEILDLPEETQNMAADALYMVIERVNEEGDYQLTEEQIAGVPNAMAQADRGEYAADTELKEIFGRPYMRVRVTDDAMADLPILPRTGHDGIVPGTFEKVVPRIPYVVIFRVDINDGTPELILLRVYHTAQDR